MQCTTWLMVKTAPAFAKQAFASRLHSTGVNAPARTIRLVVKTALVFVKQTPISQPQPGGVASPERKTWLVLKNISADGWEI